MMPRARPVTWWAALTWWAAPLILAACSATRATSQECAEIMDRIVDLELHEMGYADPALAARKRDELRPTLAPDLERCRGRSMPKGALECVRRAATAEEITHRCLH